MKHYVYWKRKWRNNDLFKNNGIIKAVVFFVYGKLKMHCLATNLCRFIE